LLFMGTAVLEDPCDRRRPRAGRSRSPRLRPSPLPNYYRMGGRKAERERRNNNISVGINDFSWYPAEGSHPFRWLRSSTSPRGKQEQRANSCVYMAPPAPYMPAGVACVVLLLLFLAGASASHGSFEGRRVLSGTCVRTMCPWPFHID
jgi:hypothetical protein